MRLHETSMDDLEMLTKMLQSWFCCVLEEKKGNKERNEKEEKEEKGNNG